MGFIPSFPAENQPVNTYCATNLRGYLWEQVEGSPFRLVQPATIPALTERLTELARDSARVDTVHMNFSHQLHDCYCLLM